MSIIFLNSKMYCNSKIIMYFIKLTYNGKKYIIFLPLSNLNQGDSLSKEQEASRK